MRNVLVTTHTRAIAKHAIMCTLSLGTRAEPTFWLMFPLKVTDLYETSGHGLVSTFDACAVVRFLWPSRL